VARGLTPVVAASLILGVVAATPPSYAVTGSPPVTIADRVTVRAGGFDEVDVTGNDTDPDGDELQVCRLDAPPRALRGSSVSAGRLVVTAGPKARGSYTLTYYACDRSYLTAGTLTVQVRPPAPTLTVEPLAGLPGKVRIHNTYKNRTFRCTWRGLGADRDEGHVTVKPRSSVVVRVRAASVEFDCTGGNASYGFGFVTDGRGSVDQRVGTPG
jgi:hypothetical protein